MTTVITHQDNNITIDGIPNTLVGGVALGSLIFGRVLVATDCPDETAATLLKLYEIEAKAVLADVAAGLPVVLEVGK